MQNNERRINNLREQMEQLKKTLAESEQKKLEADEQRIQKLHAEIDVLNKVGCNRSHF